MKNKLAKLLVIILSLSCLVLGAVACGEHEHTYSSDWTKDETSHWHVCEDEECEEIADLAEHSWNDGEITTVATCETDGVKTFTCTVCEATKTETVAKLGHSYSSDWSSNATEHWRVATCGHDVVSEKSNHTVGLNNYCTKCGCLCADVIVNSVEAFKAQLTGIENGKIIGFTDGVYDFNGETVNIDKAVTIMGFGEKTAELKNVIFDIDATYPEREMKATFIDLKFTGTSRIIIGNRTHHNGVGGTDVLPTTYLTIKDCYAKTEFSSDSLTAGKGQFVYLAAVYTVKIDLTLTGNTLINAHTIANEDASPVVNGNGTVIQNVYIANNIFGDENNPCSRYAVKFARRANNASIVIENNEVYGATTAEKDFYILDLWQSGANVQNGLDVDIKGNKINCTPNEGRTVYTAYIESSVKGSNISVTSDGSVSLIAPDGYEWVDGTLTAIPA